MKLRNILFVTLVSFANFALVMETSGFSLFEKKNTERPQKQSRKSSQKMSMQEKIAFSMQKRRFMKCYSACKKVIQIARKDVKKLEKIAKRNFESEIKTSEIENFKMVNTGFGNRLSAITTKNISSYQEIITNCNKINELLSAFKEKYEQLTSGSEEYNKAVKKTLKNIIRTIKTIEKLTNNIKNNNIKKKKGKLFSDSTEDSENRTQKRRSFNEIYDNDNNTAADM